MIYERNFEEMKSFKADDCIKSGLEITSLVQISVYSMEGIIGGCCYTLWTSVYYDGKYFGKKS